MATSHFIHVWIEGFLPVDGLCLPIVARLEELDVPSELQLAVHCCQGETCETCER